MAKQQLQKMGIKLEQAGASSRKTQGAVKAKCDEIVKAYRLQVSTALRGEAQKSKLSVDQFFEKLSKKKDSILEDTFCKTVLALEGVSVKPEHAKLLFKSVAKAATLTKY